MDFRQGQYLSSVAYFALFIVRRTVLAVTLVLLPDQLTLFGLLNCVCSVIFFLFIAIFKPFPTKIDQFDALQMESTTCIVYITASSFLLSLGSTVQAITTVVGVWTVRVAIGLNVGVSVVRSGLMGVELVRLYRLRMAKAKYRTTSGEERSWAGKRDVFFEIHT